MARGQVNSFDRIFSRPGRHEGENGSPPSVHELFSAAMRDEITLRDFAEALASCHNIRLTAASVRLLTSVDATSGRLSFSQFQRALQEPDVIECGAGKPLTIADQASAIISDNSGVPMPRAAPSQLSTHRPATDISVDPFIKQQVLLERAAQKGPFPGNPVVQTNQVSVGNPLVEQRQQQPRHEDLYSGDEMANTATRMFVGGDLSREDYESFLTKCGVHLGSESELRRLIIAHEKVGNGNFMQFKRALNREIEIAEASKNSSVR
mmetsp:Transcript_49721/g.78709  ORF Transcript_49721/g.78709 Transcript_49721/m.78709 type:complete len:265 (-) Transcript_49721:93-887(-)